MRVREWVLLGVIVLGLTAAFALTYPSIGSILIAFVLLLLLPLLMIRRFIDR